MKNELLEQNQPRYFNKIEILSDYAIRKSSADVHKITAEYEWLDSENHSSINVTTQPYIYPKSYTHPAKLRVPKSDQSIPIRAPRLHNFDISDGIASYTMQRLYGLTLSYMYTRDAYSDKKLFCSFIQSLYELIKNQSPVHVSDYMKMNIHSMYKDKTIQRLKEANIDLDEEYTINDHKTPTLREIIDICSVDLDDKDICLMHGDLCLSNIIFTERTYSPTLYLIDPRGCLPDGQITKIGDIKYDVAKLAHSFIGKYDYIHWGSFVCAQDTTGHNKYSWSLIESQNSGYVEEFFTELFKEYDYQNILIHLFLSMIPLHKDNSVKQKAMLINALRLYLQFKENKF